MTCLKPSCLSSSSRRPSRQVSSFLPFFPSMSLSSASFSFSSPSPYSVFSKSPCRARRCPSSHMMIVTFVAFAFLGLMSTTMVASSETRNYFNPLAPLPRTERPTFIPCELAELTINLMNLQGMKVPKPGFVPCTVVRGVRYLTGHYKRGMRMLMKSHRKSLSRNKFLNHLGTKTQKTAASEPSMAAVATKVATKVAANVAKQVVSKLTLKKKA